MLTGKELGAAIESARKLKGLTKKAMADAFGVKPPSIQDWVNRGTIDKEKLPKLWELFADVVGPHHWGLDQFPWALPGRSPGTVSVKPQTSREAFKSDHSAPIPTAEVAQSIGDLAYQIGLALANLSDSRRNTIAHLLAAQIRDAPNLDEARAIDLLTGGLILPIEPISEASPGTTAPLGAPIAEEHRAELDALSKAAEELHENKKQSRRVSRG